MTSSPVLLDPQSINTVSWICELANIDPGGQVRLVSVATGQIMREVATNPSVASLQAASGTPLSVGFLAGSSRRLFGDVVWRSHW